MAAIGLIQECNLETISVLKAIVKLRLNLTVYLKKLSWIYKTNRQIKEANH